MKLKLAEIRLRQGKSQADVAKASGLQVSAVSHFETGRRTPTFTNLCRLADALGVSLDAIAGRMPTCLHGIEMNGPLLQVCREYSWRSCNAESEVRMTDRDWNPSIESVHPTPDAGEKPRYFVDERGGCIAVRDREQTDPEYQGLHSYTAGVVWYEHGSNDKVEGWNLLPFARERAELTCKLFNASPLRAAGGGGEGK